MAGGQSLPLVEFDSLTSLPSQEKPLLAIVGPVGAGKVLYVGWCVTHHFQHTHTRTHTQSTILQCLLGELKPVKGSVEVKGQVSYASQEPWVFSGTLRDNILLGKTFEPDRYQSVLEACALDKAWLVYILYRRKLSRAKAFVNWRKKEKLSGIASRRCGLLRVPAEKFAENTLTEGGKYRKIRESFHPQKFPALL